MFLKINLTLNYTFVKARYISITRTETDQALAYEKDNFLEIMFANFENELEE